MRLFLTTTAFGIAATLTACATPQENPFYQYSSAYGTDSNFQSAAYETRTTTDSRGPAPIRQALPDTVYSRVEPGCWSAGDCAPVGVAPVAIADVQAPVITAPLVSETELMFEGDATPGAQAVAGVLADDLVGDAPNLSYELAAPAPPPLAPTPDVSRQAEAELPQPDVREETVLTISGPIHQAFDGTQTRALMHRVEAGDTVYSLARRYCTDVASVRELNGLDATFAIGIGQDLKVPSRCE